MFAFNEITLKFMCRGGTIDVFQISKLGKTSELEKINTITTTSPF